MRAIPLHDHESERALIGAALVAPRVVVEVGHVSAEDFDDATHALIWRAMQGLGDFEPIQVRAKVVEMGGGERAGEYLRIAEESVLSAAGAPAYAQTIRERAQRRRLVAAAERIRALATSTDHTAAQAMAEAEASLLSASSNAGGPEPVTIGTALGQYLQTLQAARDGDGMVGLATGIAKLDESTKGLRPGEVMVVAGRPGTGKSTLADQIAGSVAETGVGVLVVNLEMAAPELPVRPLARRLRKGEKEILDHIRSDWGQTELAAACTQIANLPIWIDDRPGQSIAQIRATARRWKLRHPEIGLLVIDYLQLVAAGVKTGTRAEEVAHVSRGVKVLAKELGVPVLLLSQVNRDLDKEKRRPRLADLRESAAVEQDADMVLFIHAPSDEVTGAGEGMECELLLAKCRRGGTGLIPVWFRKAWSRFEPRFSQEAP